VAVFGKCADVDSRRESVVIYTGRPLRTRCSATTTAVDVSVASEVRADLEQTAAHDVAQVDIVSQAIEQQRLMPFRRRLPTQIF
jgi:hypothetical protein